MKSKKVIIGSLIIVCLLAFNAQAFVVLQDSFNYANGSIIGVSGGTWVPGYGNTNANQIQVQGGNSVLIPGISQSF